MGIHVETFRADETNKDTLVWNLVVLFILVRAVIYTGAFVQERQLVDAGGAVTRLSKLTLNTWLLAVHANVGNWSLEDSGVTDAV